jgi:DNA-binding NarL/FixJ family response regulator
MDFTPLLDQLRDHHARVGALIGTHSLVLGLGSRAMISFLVAASRQRGGILGVATTEAETLAMVRDRRPQLLFASDRLDEGCGLALVAAAKRELPQIKTFLLVGQDARQGWNRRRLEACCDGVMLESRIGSGSDLTAIRSVLEGHRFIDGGLTTTASPSFLTAREIEVLQAIANGAKNATIASLLFLSTDTVKTHIRSILTKLGARDRTHAIALAMRARLIR